MPSDIRLEDNRLVLEGDARVDVIAADLVLEHPSRRSSPEGFRRALVHTEEDGLTINVNRDYPGGVMIEGTLRLDQVGIEGRLLLDMDPPTPGANIGVEVGPGVNPDFQPDLVDLDIEGLFDNVASPVNVAAEIRRLRQAVLQLNRRLNALEGRA